MVRLDWGTVIGRVKEIVTEFPYKHGFKPTLRGVFYILVSEGLIPNTKKSYQYLSKRCVKARMDGILPWNCFQDKTREGKGTYDDYYISAEDFFEYRKADYEEAETRFRESWKYFGIGKWYKQPKYVEVWLEKEALTDVVYSITALLGVRLNPARGYSSWTFLYENIQMLNEDKEIWILYLGDFDPSGEDIARFIKEAYDFFGKEINFEKIAITKEQIEKYELPHRPEDASEIEKLKRDPRFRRWPYGLYRVELDALAALQPETFKRLIEEGIEKHFDEEIWEEVREEREELRKKVKEMIEEYFANRTDKE